MVTYDELEVELRRLIATMGRPFDWEDVESGKEYYRVVCRYSVDVVHRAVTTLIAGIDDRRNFPTPGRLIQACRQANGDVEGLHPGKPMTVESCGDCLLGIVYDDRGNPQHMCNCEAGQWRQRLSAKLRGTGRVKGKGPDRAHGQEPCKLTDAYREELARIQGERV